MKRIFALIVTLSMLLALAACGTESASSSAAVSVPAAETETTAPAEEPSVEEPVKTEAPEETPTSVEAPDSAESPAAAEKPASVKTPPTSITLDGETVLVDNEFCTVKIMGVDPDNMWGYTWNVYLENKTEQTLMFSMDNVSVNGIMCDPFWASSVTPGMKSNEEVSWDSTEFEQYGITEPTVIEFNFTVYDDENWDSDDLVNENFIVYPLGEDAVQLVEYTPAESDITLFETDDCAMYVTGFDPDGLWGYTVNVYLVNKTDTTLMFSVDNASVNGFMCDPFWASSVAPGKAAFQEISWTESDFEANSITEVERIELPMTVYDDESFLADNLIDETFTLEP